MTTLIQGHTVLKSTEALQSGNSVYRYRLTLDENNHYVVHVEVRSHNGGLGEQFLYQGDSIDTANHVYDFYRN